MFLLTYLLTSNPVSTEIGDDVWQVYYPCIYTVPLSLAIPLCTMSTGDGFNHLRD